MNELRLAEIKAHVKEADMSLFPEFQELITYIDELLFELDQFRCPKCGLLHNVHCISHD